MAALGCALVLVAATAACTGGDEAGDDAGGPAAPVRTGPAPTAAGDPPVVELLSAGAEPRATLRLTPETGASTSTRVGLDQRLVSDGTPTTVPSLTMTVTTTVDGVDGTRLDLGQSFTDVAAGGEGSGAGTRAAVEALDGADGRVGLGTDGVVLSASLGLPEDVEPAVRRTVDGLRDQVLALTPVLPSEPVGEGASWSVTSVVVVGGVTVDQTTTYTLDTIADGDYVVDYVLDQEYRPGEVGRVTLTQGTASASGRLEGSLGSVVPRRAVGSTSSTVGYRVGGAVTLVESSVRVELTAS
ncbi:hypothetical protein GCM10023340_12180 [Nocardioides marinquilinus]|uniref:Uncharacterized protein n=1 Tax=Nocardioides marinquilinus TaxID=1210400 RepID=A0ABP9PCS8_9ACTN